MAGRGIHFALTNAQMQAVLAVAHDDELMAVVELIEEEWDEKYLAESDKAWNAIHRCLTDGRLLYESGSIHLIIASVVVNNFMEQRITPFLLFLRHK